MNDDMDFLEDWDDSDIWEEAGGPAASFFREGMEALEENQDEIPDAFGEGIAYYLNKLTDAINGGEIADLPLLLAAVRMLTSALEQQLGEEGVKIADDVLSLYHISNISINMEELVKQAMEEGLL